MPLLVRQSAFAIGPALVASFQASGGEAPYTYSVLPGGAGGSINAATGRYTAPAAASSDPTKAYETVLATDSLGDTGTARVLVGLPLLLFCDVIQRGMNLPDGRVYLWDQKITEPSDNGLFIPIAITSLKPFGSSNRFNGSSGQSEQYVAMHASLDVNLMSRGPAARDRKEELILALDSNYSRFQQDANSFYISKLDRRFTNLSSPDGAAIPYRFVVSVQMQYAYAKNTNVEYFDNFEGPEIAINE